MKRFIRTTIKNSKYIKFCLQFKPTALLRKIIIFHNIYKVIVATQSPKLVIKTRTSFVRFSNFQFWFLSGFLIHRHTRTGVCTLCKFAKIFSKKVKSPLSWVANQRCPGWQMFDSSLRHRVLQIT